MILQISTFQIRPGISVVQLKGSVHAGTDCRKLEQQVEGVIQEKTQRIILDLTHVTHIDSSAIGSIVRCLMNAKKIGGTIRIAGVKGMLEGTLKLTKVDKLFEIYPTPEAAAENFETPGQPATT